MALKFRPSKVWPPKVGFDMFRMIWNKLVKLLEKDEVRYSPERIAAAKELGCKPDKVAWCSFSHSWQRKVI
jgi:hypothetical protein